MPTAATKPRTVPPPVAWVTLSYTPNDYVRMVARDDDGGGPFRIIWADVSTRTQRIAYRIDDPAVMQKIRNLFATSERKDPSGTGRPDGSITIIFEASHLGAIHDFSVDESRLDELHGPRIAKGWPALRSLIKATGKKE
jgi:hypothetical protein